MKLIQELFWCFRVAQSHSWNYGENITKIASQSLAADKQY